MTDISSMTNEQLNDALAIEVMGKDKHYATIYSIDKGRAWQPTRDLNQAVECAEFLRDKYKFTFEVQTWSEPKVYLVSMYSKDGKALADTEHKNLSRALSEAVLMAVRGEGKGFETAMKRVVDENKGAWKALGGEEGKG